MKPSETYNELLEDWHKLEVENFRLREALAFYADYAQYDSAGPGDLERPADHGRMARQVLGIPERPTSPPPDPKDVKPVFTGEVADLLNKTIRDLK